MKKPKAYENQHIFNHIVDSKGTKAQPIIEPTHKLLFIDLCSKLSEKERESI